MMRKRRIRSRLMDRRLLQEVEGCIVFGVHSSKVLGVRLSMEVDDDKRSRSMNARSLLGNGSTTHSLALSFTKLDRLRDSCSGLRTRQLRIHTIMRIRKSPSVFSIF